MDERKGESVRDNVRSIRTDWSALEHNQSVHPLNTDEAQAIEHKVCDELDEQRDHYNRLLQPGSNAFRCAS